MNVMNIFLTFVVTFFVLLWVKPCAVPFPGIFMLFGVYVSVAENMLSFRVV